jgi:hypothetical protein
MQFNRQYIVAGLLLVLMHVITQSYVGYRRSMQEKTKLESYDIVVMIAAYESSLPSNESVAASIVPKQISKSTP